MKSKKLMMLLGLFVFIGTLVGCSNNVNNDNDVEGYMTLDSYYNNLVITTNDSEMPTFDTQTIDFAGSVGTTLKASMEVVEYVSIEPIAQNDVFEGWIEFKVIVETDEDGFDTYTYQKVSDTLYTTDQLLEKTFSEEQMVYAAKWASIDIDTYYVEEDAMWEADSTALYLNANEGMMSFQTPDGESYEVKHYAYWLSEGESINTLVSNEESGYDSIIAIENLGNRFSGWTVYTGDCLYWSSEASLEDGEMSFETGVDSEGFEYIILGNGLLYKESVTTDELCEFVSDGVTNYYAVANWN